MKVGRHDEVARRCPACADSGSLILANHSLVVVEVFLVVDLDAGLLSGTPRRNRRAMYSGQFEIRSVPLPGRAVAAAARRRRSSPTTRGQEGGPRASAAAAAAPPPMNRRREVRLAARRAASSGSIVVLGHGDCAFRGFRGRGDGFGRTSRHESSSISSRSSVVGMSAAGSTSEASGAQLTWTWSPGRSIGRSCSGPTCATIVESSGAAQRHRTTGPWNVRSVTVAHARSRRPRSARPSTPGRVRAGPSASRGRPARSWCRRAGPSTRSEHLDLDEVAVGAGRSADPATGWPGR